MKLFSSLTLKRTSGTWRATTKLGTFTSTQEAPNIKEALAIEPKVVSVNNMAQVAKGKYGYTWDGFHP